VIIGLKSIPLDEYVENSHSKSQMCLKIFPNSMSYFLKRSCLAKVNEA
jgi:hypothetical protein